METNMFISMLESRYFFVLETCSALLECVLKVMFCKPQIVTESRL